MIEETYRLAKDNNRMLHAMRRNAFLGGILKFAFWIIVVVVLPLWLYVTYLAPLLENAMETMEKVQGTGAQAEAQFADFQNALHALNPSQYFGQ